MTVTLDGQTLSIEAVVAVAREGETVEIAADAIECVRESRARVEDILETGEPVYGVNTGFGELVDTRIPEAKVADLQENLVRSHAAGAGRERSREEVRAMMVTRLNALLRGYSGIRVEVVELLAGLLNAKVTPVVPSSGSLGASGDLAPLAHLALVMIGDGTADVVQGNRSGENADSRRLPGEKALATVGLEPVELAAKEGLALINGTQLTLGIAALLVADAERLCRAVDVSGALTTEVTMGTTAACAESIHELRPHAGQAASARMVRTLTANSEVVESHRNCDRVQDAYSIRCLPQVHGAVRDAVSHLREAVAVELNSVTDNPIVFPREELESKDSGTDGDRTDPDRQTAIDRRASGTDRAAVVSGGNFHGGPLAHRLDYLSGALTDLAAISERRTDRILNPNLQEPHLPPFLATDPGLESGLMIAQYTAAALVNECRTIGRAATDNTPVSGGQEDHVSMSATAALNARRVLERTRTVVATELFCGVEAAEYVDEELGDGTTVAYETVREVVPPLSGDRPLTDDVTAIEAVIETGLLADTLEKDLGIDLESPIDGVGGDERNGELDDAVEGSATTNSDPSEDEI